MNIPAWKKWLSYVVDITIEETSSPYNPVLEVSLRRGQFQLSTANAVYSYGDRYTNFSRVFDRLDWVRMPGKEVLLLGLGLGSIPYMLERSYGHSFYYTAIDIDEEVLLLADKYLLGELRSPLQQICADAAVFVEISPDESYDLICVDLFEDNRIPAAFSAPGFMEELARIQSPEGLVLFNSMAFTKEEHQASEAFFENIFREVFPHAEALLLGGNYMLVSDRRYLK